MWKPEIGKYGRARNGEKIGPLTETVCDDMVAAFSPKSLWFRADGRAEGGGTDDFKPEYDLIAEWTDEPDLTAITTPFCLLDEATQAALKAHHSAGGEVEFFDSSGEWFVASKEPGYLFTSVYRAKPAPAAPQPEPLADRLQRILTDGLKTANNEGATLLAALDLWAAERGITIKEE